MPTQIHMERKYSYFPSNNDPLEVNDQNDGDVSFETMEAKVTIIGGI